MTRNQIPRSTLYYFQGRYADAEPLYKRSLAIREKTLGPSKPEVAQTLNDLARLYTTQGRYVDAEPLYKRSLTIYEKSLGPNHPNVAIPLTNFATLYTAQGRYADAEPLYKRSLAIQEKALGSDHPDVANSLSELAALYSKQGQYADAEPLYKRSLAINEKSFGPGHPECCEINEQFRRCYIAPKVDTRMPSRSTSDRWRSMRKSLGPDHPDVATSLNNLALLYYEQGRYADAEPLYKRSLAIREKAVGPDHPDAAAALDNLAWLYDKGRSLRRRRATLQAIAGDPREGRSVRTIPMLRHRSTV